ncbi:MAG: hypothetical protein QOH12_3524 [Solirubrobacteraceae bacterium]|jgi:ribosomal protein L32|nr:hypothetical protein [Solirubrobacteraceae bacterium]
MATQVLHVSADATAALTAVPSPSAARRRARRSADDGGSASGDGFALTSISWTAADDMGFEQWVVNGRRLGAVGRSVGWWIGDWLSYGNTRYGEKYAQAARITGYDTQTLMNMVYVAGNIDPLQRRETLSWSHHAEVAALESDEQERWLDRAEESRLSVRDLRLLLRKSRSRDKQLKVVHATAAQDHALVCPECGHAFESAKEDAREPRVRLAEAPSPGTRSRAPG